ncbi:MAG: hypothetical protein JWM91_658 [Rhodospirillales bacterium]|nr:hypothetical protein [Rhodospirillales bacterium]
MRWTVLSLMGAASLLLSGCGEVAYKTGAGADALQGDQQTCKQAVGGPAAYKTCMNAKGWTIADLDAGPSSTYIPPKVAPGGAPAPAPTSPAETPWMKPTTAAAAPIPPVTDPMAPVPVTAWVKFGGGDPKDAIATCVTTLGPANEPDKAHKTVTVALLSCMRGRGWRGI